MDKGRIRFGGLDTSELRLTVAALVGVGALIMLILFPTLVPSDHTIPLYPNPGPQSVDMSAPAILLLGLGFFVGLLVYAAASCPRYVRVIAAIGFLMIGGQLASFIGETWGGVVPVFVLTSYFVVPLALLVSASEGSKLAARLGRSWAVAISKSGWVALVGVGVFFLGSVLVYILGLHDAAFQVSVTSSFIEYVAVPIQYTLTNFYSAMLVLFIIASLAVVRFAYGIGQVAAGVARRTPILRARWALVVLIAAEVFFVLRDYPGQNWQALAAYPQIALLSGLSLGLFVWMAFAARGLFGRPRREVETEHLTILGATAYALPLIVVGALTCASWVETVFFPGKDGYTAIFNIFGWATPYAEDPGFQIGAAAAVFALLVVVGMRRADRGESPEKRQAGFGLALLAGWALWTYIVGFVGSIPLYSALLYNVALVVTAAVAVDLVRHWNHLSADRLGVLAGVVVLSWLVSTDGGFLSIVGRLIGMQSNVPLAFGSLLTILGASEFTGGNSRPLPRRARPLVWLSYIGISLLFKLWFQLSHGLNTLQEEYILDTNFSYLLMAPPFAAWLVVTGWFEEQLSPREADRVASKSPPVDRPRTEEAS